MLVHYLVLGLPLAASDEEIRQRYLQLVRENPPSRDPHRFAKIQSAYEALKDSRARIQTTIFGILEYPDFEKALRELVEARRPVRNRPGLKELLRAEGALNE